MVASQLFSLLRWRSGAVGLGVCSSVMKVIPAVSCNGDAGRPPVLPVSMLWFHHVGNPARVVGRKRSCIPVSSSKTIRAGTFRNFVGFSVHSAPSTGTIQSAFTGWKCFNVFHWDPISFLVPTKVNALLVVVRRDPYPFWQILCAVHHNWYNRCSCFFWRWLGGRYWEPLWQQHSNI